MADDRMRWARRAGAAAVIAIGWGFIALQNQVHLSAAVVLVMLGWLAVVLTIYNLWRVGVTAVADPDADTDVADSTWGRTLGLRGELEREKRILLKAIKEVEFDHEMGKLSKAHEAEMVARYRAQAIDVMKQLDKLDKGAAGTAREQIERELKARLEVARKTKGKPKRKQPIATGSGQPAIADEAGTEAEPVVEAAAEPEAEAGAEPEAEAAAVAEPEPEAAAEPETEPETGTQVERPAAKEAAK